MTLLTGLYFRWMLAGVAWEPLTHFGIGDWRRSHSHVGYYGILFPLLWMILGKMGAWTPSGWLWKVYVLCVAVSAAAFIYQGYGLVSIIASTGVLFVWLVFAWKNSRGVFNWSRSWFPTIPISIYISGILIPVVAILSRSNAMLANQVARCFLTVLLLGAFVPVTLRTLGGTPPLPWPWILATLASGAYLTGLREHPAWGLGLIWLAFEILRSLVAIDRRKVDLRIFLLWFTLALGLGTTGAGFIPPSHPHSIASLHFMILGPVLMSFVLLHLQTKIPGWIRWAYEISLLVMVIAIFFQLHPYYAAIAGTLLVLVIVGACLKADLSSSRAQ